MKSITHCHKRPSGKQLFFSALDSKGIIFIGLFIIIIFSFIFLIVTIEYNALNNTQGCLEKSIRMS